MPLAISTGLQIAYVIALVVVPFLGPVTVAELKGLEILVATGFTLWGIAWWIAAFSVAKPETWWAAILWSAQTLPGRSSLGRRRTRLLRFRWLSLPLPERQAPTWSWPTRRAADVDPAPVRSTDAPLRLELIGERLSGAGRGAGNRGQLAGLSRD